MAAPALLVGSVVAGPSGCTTALENSACDQQLQVKAQAFEGAVADLVTVAGQMKSKLGTACAAMANDLGVTGVPKVTDWTTEQDSTLTQVCTMASTAIKAKIDATAHIVPIVVPPHCTVDAMTQFSCEAMCDVSGACMPGTIEERCNPPDLSGECDGECMAMATCEGSASVMAQCQGSCNAQCTGTCSGNCRGTCDGTASTGMCTGMCVGDCDASCKGTCNGDCKIDANAMVMCGASATCRGGCSVAYKMATCEGTLKPPSCNIDSECEAACSGQGTISATCTQPTVTLLPGADATLAKTLTANYPDVVAVGAQAALVAQAAANVSTAAQNVVTEVSNSAGCAVVIGVEFATKIQASVAASASITVSVMASVDLTTSLGG